jgi:hypothetical protein
MHDKNYNYNDVLLEQYRFKKGLFIGLTITVPSWCLLFLLIYYIFG